MHRSSALLALLALAAPAFGQNLVKNGDFTKFTSTDNVWDGVDSSNFLRGFQRGTYAVTDSGKIGDQPMPISVNYVDVNGDGLPDIVTADPTGVIRAYINSGTKTEPKWTHAEIIPIFPPQIARDSAYDRSLWTSPHGVPKLAMFDWDRRGAPDLIIGNYTGDILMIPNTGSNSSPVFAQPTNYEKIRIPTSAKGKPWGNLFAPCAYDWNKDGKTDLLIGEGTYSANAVYVLLNKGSGSAPKFSEEDRSYLVYGDGREQLVPTVVDYNGDGLPDVLVGDRKGQVGVYLNKGDWKPGVELPLASFISFGATNTLGGPVAPYACDYNGDGLFDLLIGKANGRIAVAINKGTKSEPKFDAPVEVTGVDLMTEKVNNPEGTRTGNFNYDGWSTDAGNNRANLYAYFSVDAKEASPNGGKVLKSGYYPSPNKVFKMTTLGVDGKDTEDFFRYWYEVWYPQPAPWAGWVRPSDQFVIRQEIGAIKTGVPYTLSFKVRGKAIQEGVATVAILGAAENVAKKFQKNERGAVKALKDETHEEILESEKFSSSNQWKTVEKTFTLNFKERALKTLTESTLAVLEFKYTLPQFSGECDICDVQLVAKAAK
jgi:hypothetical protein